MKIQVRIMSHNVWGMFSKTEKIGDRNAMMSGIYHAYQPDLLGMQEVSLATRGSNATGQNLREDSLPEMISDLYTEVDVSRDVKAKEVANLFVPVFAHNTRTKIIDKGFHLYDRAYSNADSKALTWVVCEFANGARIGLVNTHYWWKSVREDPKNGIARNQNSREALAVIRTIRKKYGVPVLLMGDLNCRIDSEAYGLLLAGGMADVQAVAPISVDSTTHHRYPTYSPENDTYRDAPAPSLPYSAAIDHILITKEDAALVKEFCIITSADACNSSDHCPIYVDLEL